eukprot:s1007_g12.t1
MISIRKSGAKLSEQIHYQYLFAATSTSSLIFEAQQSCRQPGELGGTFFFFLILKMCCHSCENPTKRDPNRGLSPGGILYRQILQLLS